MAVIDHREEHVKHDHVVMIEEMIELESQSNATGLKIIEHLLYIIRIYFFI